MSNETKTNVAEEKDNLRSYYRRLRASIPVSEREQTDKLVQEKVISSSAFEEAGIIFSYLAFNDEIETRDVIQEAWRRGKVVALPRCTGPHTMRWFKVSSFEGLEVSRFGIDEPPIDESKEVFPNGADFKGAVFANPLALVPAFSFDNRGFRLGYGGGFYDTFLSSFEGVSMGICRVRQLSDKSLPHDTHDLPVNIVATENGCAIPKASC